MHFKQNSAGALSPPGMVPNPQLPVEALLRGSTTGVGSTYAASGSRNIANGMIDFLHIYKLSFVHLDILPHCLSVFFLYFLPKHRQETIISMKFWPHAPQQPCRNTSSKVCSANCESILHCTKIWSVITII